VRVLVPSPLVIRARSSPIRVLLIDSLFVTLSVR